MQLIFPAYNFKIKKVENRNYVFDIIRKKYILLTPEEWVRQHLVHYLIDAKQCPPSLLGIEKGIKVGALNKRVDVVVFDDKGKPLLLAECKSPDVTLTTATLQQAAVYNKTLGVEYLLITNGLSMHICKYSNGFNQFEFLTELGAYPFKQA